MCILRQLLRGGADGACAAITEIRWSVPGSPAGGAGYRAGPARPDDCPEPAGSEVRSRPVLAQADAQQLGAGTDDWLDGGRSRSRLDHPPRQRSGEPGSHRAGVPGARAAAGERVLPGGTAGPRVRRRREPGRQLGRPAAQRALSVAGIQPRHRRGSQRQRLDRRQRRSRRAHPEVLARRQVHRAVRQSRGAQGSEVPGRQAGLHRQQRRHGQLRPRRQDLHRPQGERGLRV